jgi:glycosyl transferase family 1
MSKPRVCMLSQREIRKSAAWCSMYEFEDVICDVDDVERIDLRPGTGYSWRRRFVSSLVWHKVVSSLSAKLNPGLSPIQIKSDYDLFAFICINPWELLYLNAVHGWKERCRKKVCYIFEVWAGLAHQYEPFLSLLREFDHVFLGWKSSVASVERIVGVPCHHVSPAVDTMRFSPYPNLPRRCIDVLSVGRRLEAMHKQLFNMATAGEIFYIHDTIPGRCIEPSNHREHRELYANLGKRSRYFVTYPAKVDVAEETQGISEPGMRYYEGIATGAVLVGECPGSETFTKEFNWPNSVINIGDRAENLINVMKTFHREPEKFGQISRTNSAQALRRHDWAHRWNDMLQISGLAPTGKLEARKGQLSKLAAIAESASRT